MIAKIFLYLQQFIIAQFIFVVTMITTKINAFFNIRTLQTPYVLQATPYLFFWQIRLVYDEIIPKTQKKGLLLRMKKIAKNSRSYERLKSVFVRTPINDSLGINSVFVFMVRAIGTFDDWENLYELLSQLETNSWFKKTKGAKVKEICMRKMIEKAFWKQEYVSILGKISKKDARRTQIEEKMHSAPMLDLMPKTSIAHDPIFG